MHQRGAATTWQDTGHLVMGGVSLALMLAVIAAGARAFGQRFRLFSVAVGIAVFAAGMATFALVPRDSASLPTPWLGVIERVMPYCFLVWVATLAATLLRRRA